MLQWHYYMSLTAYCTVPSRDPCCISLLNTDTTDMPLYEEDRCEQWTEMMAEFHLLDSYWRQINALTRRLALKALTSQSLDTERHRCRDPCVILKTDKSVFMLMCCPSPQVHQENQHLTQLHPESEPTTVDAPMKGNTTTPRPTSSATTLVTATAAGSTATPNLPPLAALPHPARCRKPATSRWEGTGL